MTPDQRASLLDSLRSGVPVPRALASALGIRQTGRAWRAAWAALETVRGEDGEVREACEGEERDGEAEQVGKDLGEMEGVEAGAKREGGGPREGAAQGGEGQQGEGLSDDGSEQDGSMAGASTRGGHEERWPLPGPTVPRSPLALPHGLGAGGRGRAEEESEEEGGGDGEEESDPVGLVARSEEGLAESSGAPRVAGLPPGWAPLRRVTVDEDEESREIPSPPTTVYSKRAAETTDDGTPDWQAIRNEAAEMAPGPFGWVLWQENRLARSGHNFPALSPFVLCAIDCFFMSGKRWFLLMAGRGFCKSTLTARLATAIGFAVDRRAAPGPAWVCPLVSVLPVDADRRLEDIQQILLHAYLQEVKIATGKSMIAGKDAGGNPIAWVASASTIGNVSGPSSFAALVDEEEKILHGRAGGIVGSLAYTFRSRPHVYGFRVSSAMTVDGTLARACAKGNGPGSPLTNHVTTLGPFLGEAVDGLLAVAAWEDGRGQHDAATAIRKYVETLTPDSWQIPTWLGHPSIGRPTDDAPWGPGDAAIATRIEAEAMDERNLDGLAPWRYWLRECASAPTGGEEMADDSDWAILGIPHRNADLIAEDRFGGYDRR